MRQSIEDTSDCLLYILVRQSLVIVLQCQADCILLLSRRNLVASVDIEEHHLAQQLPLSGKRSLADIGECDILIQQQSQIPLHLRIQRQLLVQHLGLEIVLQQQLPVNLRREHRLFDIELTQPGRSHRTEHQEYLAR